MNIIVDLHAFKKNFTGKHHYTLTLLNHLFAHPEAKNHHFVLASPKRLDLSLPPTFEWLLLSKQPLKYYYQLAESCKLKAVSCLISPTSYLTPLLSQIPTIQIIYDLAAWQKGSFAKNRKATLLEKALLPTVVNRAHQLICISQFTQSQLNTKFSSAKSKTLVIPGSPRHLPLPNNHLSILKTYGLSLKTYYLFVGSIEPRKNLPNLLRAYHAFIQRHPNGPDLVIAGANGWHYQEVYQTHHQLRLGERVKFLGRVTDDQLATLYHHSLALTYVPFYEGFGLPVIENLAFGKPVITSNTSSLPEAAGSCGILVDPTNINDITHALSQIHTNQQLYKKLQSHIPKHLKSFDLTSPINDLWRIITTINA